MIAGILIVRTSKNASEAAYQKAEAHQNGPKHSSSEAPFQNLFQVALAVQYGDHLQRGRFRAVDDNVIGKFCDGPETQRQGCDI